MSNTFATVEVTDDTGAVIHLAEPAQRIVSLAPHATEMLFSAGAGHTLVGAVDFSDYPAEAKAVPRIGSFQHLDFERLIALKPDLVIGWATGNPAALLERVRKLNFPLYLSEPGDLESIPSNIERLAKLAGTEGKAHAATAPFREHLRTLRERYSNSRPVGVFYQVWHQPLMTINGDHIVSDVMALCGGFNVFETLPELAPRISVEAVLEKNPQVIIGSGADEQRPQWLDDWRAWPQLKAVKNEHLFFIPPDIIQRHSLRLLQGADILCRQLDQVRSELGS